MSRIMNHPERPACRHLRVTIAEIRRREKPRAEKPRALPLRLVSVARAVPRAKDVSAITHRQRLRIATGPAVCVRSCGGGAMRGTRSLGIIRRVGKTRNDHRSDCKREVKHEV